MTTTLAVTIAFLLPSTSTGASPVYPTGKKLRALVYKTDPCLAQIIDRENPPWEPRLYNGFTLWQGGPMRNRSYGLPQALPPWKMASAGKDWRTSPWVQLKWMKIYTTTRYGSPCAALSFWLRHRWY